MNLKTFLAPAAVIAALGLSCACAQAAPFDQQFIDSMVPHHMMATEMAQVAISKARFPEVRRLARAIMSSQMREIGYMKRLRKAFYGSAEVPMNGGNMMHAMGGKAVGGKAVGGKMEPGMMKGGDMVSPGEMMGLPMKMRMDMGKLSSASGTQVDRLFLKMMIPHHASAISMAQEALDTTARPQLRALALKIIDAQAQEIGLMHAIYDRRFGSLARG